MHNEIELRLKFGNEYYFVMSHFLSQSYYLKKSKKSYIPRVFSRLYQVRIAVPIHTWVTTTGDENKKSIFERMVFKNIYRSIYNSDTQVWEGRINEELKHLYMEKKVGIDKLKKKSGRIEWVGYIRRTDIV